MADTAAVKIAVGVVACVLVLAGCGSGGDEPADTAPAPVASPGVASSTAPAPISMIGDVALPTAGWISATGSAGEVCTGTGGYSDLKTGAQVVVTDNAGATVALGSVTQAQVSLNTDPPTCVLNFSVPDVPGGKGFYGVAVGKRDPVQVSEADARANVSLSFD